MARRVGLGGIFGGGGIQIERITPKITLIGIFLFGILQVVLRLLTVLLVCASILAIGRQAGGIIAVATLLRLQISIITGRIDRQSTATLLITWLSITLIIIDTIGYWPVNIIDWRWDQVRMYYSLWGGDFVPATSVTLLARLFIAVVLPIVSWRPARLMDWALGTEIAWPLARTLPFAPGDPGSIPAPDDIKIEQSRRTEPSTNDDPENTIIQVPQMIVEGQ